MSIGSLLKFRLSVGEVRFWVACLAVLGSMTPATVDADAGADDFLVVDGGLLITGDPEGDPNEIERRVEVAPFRLMRHEVTNQAFAAFVAQTGHVTDVERAGEGYVWTGRWRLIEGADWRRPSGPGSDIIDRDNHPVVQVSRNDAEAFCAHYGWRLPSEEEWAFAARGEDRRRFPWGDTPPEQVEGVTPLANFGTVPCCAPDATDGYETTAPVGGYPAGAGPFGHLDLAGNVWEWTSSRFPERPEYAVIRGGGWGNNPYCLRTAYRHGNPDHFGLDMVGFRCSSNEALQP
ncbi:MAG: formylglycine-generating enzyme family protein [Geminicoccaceae bacterium]